MRQPLLALLSAVLLLGACGALRDSPVNPANWFGRSTEQTVTEGSAPAATPTDPRPLVDTIVAMEVARHPGGAIVHATGLPAAQGYWDAALLPESTAQDAESGTLVLGFRAFPPPRPERAGPQRSRELTAGYHLTDQELSGITRIVVRGAQNQRSSRR